MKIELIPVIEISNWSEDIETPTLGPFWEYEDEWENYNRICNKAAGFSDDLKPYKKASSLYKITELSDVDLLRIIQKEISLEQTDETDVEVDLGISLSGGYILELDGKAVYFPQCCGSLANIKEWQDLLNGKTRSFFAGHPFPRITESQNHICFDFVDIEVKENFAPPCLLDVLEIEKLDLKIAILEVNKVLESFRSKLLKINETENLRIKRIDKKLIWGETNF